MRRIDLEKLDLLTLSILVSLYENKSATHVSRVLNVPASKISRCLQTARSIFGNELFLRKKYGLVPNEYATKIYPIAKDIVDCSKNFNRINGEKIMQNRYFELVIPGMISYAYPKALMLAIKEQNKDIHINVDSWNNHSLQTVIDDPLSIVMCCCKRAEEIFSFDQTLHVETLVTLSRLYLVCSKEHPILKQDITLDKIAEYPYINTLIGVQAPLLSPFQEYCQLNELSLNTEMTITSITSLFEYLSDSQALAIVPYKAVYDMLDNESDLHACQLSEYETNRLFNTVEPLILALVTHSSSINDETTWLKQQIRDLTLELV